MYHRSHETAAPKTSDLTPVRRSEAPEPDVTPSHLSPLSLVAPDGGVAPQPRMQAAVLNRASGGQLARTGPALLQLQRQYGNRYVQRVVGQARETTYAARLQEGNKTGLPDRLKADMENLSGLSLDDVTVHYNSSKPARLQALAYTQGTDIHIGPGQETHLAHEAWHVVQQKQGRVQPTMQAKGVAISDDRGLEKEADVMGERANRGVSDRLQRKDAGDSYGRNNRPSFTPRILQRKRVVKHVGKLSQPASAPGPVVQRWARYETQDMPEGNCWPLLRDVHFSYVSEKRPTHTQLHITFSDSEEPEVAETRGTSRFLWFNTQDRTWRWAGNNQCYIAPDDVAWYKEKAIPWAEKMEEEFLETIPVHARPQNEFTLFLQTQAAAAAQAPTATQTPSVTKSPPGSWAAITAGKKY